MSWQTELKSWMSPTALPVSELPLVGQEAPSRDRLQIPYDGKPTIVTFLRHCGCPFAEKTFRSLRETALNHPGIHCIAVSHSDEPSTTRWLEALGGAQSVNILVDPERQMYATWGLAVSSFWHVLSPWSLYSVYKLGKQEGIWNRPTESGNRWQSSGSFGVDSEGVVRWAKPAQSADDIPDFDDAVNSVQSK